MEDLTEILNAWPYDPEHAMRIITALDGRSVLQVRQPLGIEQYELDGRPDGTHPHGYGTILEYVQDRLKQHIVDTGGDAGFHVSVEDAALLQGEGVLFYYRYLLLFQLSHYERVVRDTTHNLNLCDLLERYCENEEARNGVLQFRPYIIRMYSAARAMAIAEGSMAGNAQAVIHEGIVRIEELEEIDSPAFQFERIRSVNYLRALQRKLSGDDVKAEDPDERSQLERELRNAVETEDYERAARIRDLLRRRE